MFNNKKMLIIATIGIVILLIASFSVFYFRFLGQNNQKKDLSVNFNTKEINSPENFKDIQKDVKKDIKKEPEDKAKNKTDIIKKAKVVNIDQESMLIDAYVFDILGTNIEKLNQAEKAVLLKKIQVSDQTLYKKIFIKKVGESIEIKEDILEFKDIKINDIFSFNYKNEENNIISDVSEIDFLEDVDEFPASLGVFGNSFEQRQDNKNQDEISIVKRDENLEYFHGKISAIDKEKKVIEYINYVDGKIIPDSKKYFVKINDASKLYKTLVPQKPLDNLAKEISFEQVLAGQDIYVLDIKKDNFTKDNIYIAEKIIIK